MDIVIKQLSDRLKENNIMDKVLNTTCTTTNIDKDTLLRSNRTYPVKLARIVSNNIMLNEFDINKARVGPFHNRDRSSCYYYQKVHDENYVYWKDYSDLYNTVQKEVTNGAKFKKITKNQIRFILKKHKISDDSLATHRIKCKIGDKKFNILARHQILFNKLDSINEAFDRFNLVVTYKEL